MAQVRARRRVFFGGKLRDVDAIFDCPTESQFSTRAMELLEGESFDEPKVEEAKPKKKPGRKPKVEVSEVPEENVEPTEES